MGLAVLRAQNWLGQGHSRPLEASPGAPGPESTGPGCPKAKTRPGLVRAPGAPRPKTRRASFGPCVPQDQNEARARPGQRPGLLLLQLREPCRHLDEPVLEHLDHLRPVQVRLLVGHELGEVVVGQVPEPGAQRRDRQLVVVRQRQRAARLGGGRCLGSRACLRGGRSLRLGGRRRLGGGDGLWTRTCLRSGRVLGDGLRGDGLRGDGLQGDGLGVDRLGGDGLRRGGVLGGSSVFRCRGGCCGGGSGVGRGACCAPCPSRTSASRSLRTSPAASTTPGLLSSAGRSYHTPRGVKVPQVCRRRHLVRCGLIKVGPTVFRWYPKFVIKQAADVMDGYRYTTGVWRTAWRPRLPWGACLRATAGSC